MIKRAAAIHDISGLGRCSLTMALPILSVLGTQCCPVPTAVLSSQTDGYRDYTFTDLTEALPDYIAHWKKNGEQFDAIYTGFLGSAKQIDIVADFIDTFRSPQTLVLVDPVMGDNGHGLRLDRPRHVRRDPPACAPRRHHHAKPYGGRHPAWRGRDRGR